MLPYKNTTMNKEKFANGMMWIAMSVLFIFTASLTFYIGFSKDSVLLLVLGIMFMGCLFFFAYKGLKSTLDAFFDETKKTKSKQPKKD